MNCDVTKGAVISPRLEKTTPARGLFCFLILPHGRLVFITWKIKNKASVLAGRLSGVFLQEAANGRLNMMFSGDLPNFAEIFFFFN